MKIIFLDIDGVLNSVESMVRKYYEKTDYYFSEIETRDKLREDYSDWPDKYLVDNLKFIIAKTNCSIVISSTWRYRGVKYMKEVFELLGLDPNIIIGITPKLQGFERGYEIQRWIDENQNYDIEDFVILDDGSDMAPLRHKLVKIDVQYGLQFTNAVDAIKRLNNVPELERCLDVYKQNKG